MGTRSSSKTSSLGNEEVGMDGRLIRFSFTRNSVRYAVEAENLFLIGRLMKKRLGVLEWYL